MSSLCRAQHQPLSRYQVRPDCHVRPPNCRYDWAVTDVPSNPTLISANPHKTQSTNGVIMSPLWTLLQIDLICQLYCSITCHTGSEQSLQSRDSWQPLLTCLPVTPTTVFTMTEYLTKFPPSKPSALCDIEQKCFVIDENSFSGK